MLFLSVALGRKFPPVLGSGTALFFLGISFVSYLTDTESCNYSSLFVPAPRMLQGKGKAYLRQLGWNSNLTDFGMDLGDWWSTLVGVVLVV